METFHKTVEAYQQGARTMAGRYYTSPDIHAEEREQIFSRHWICAGRRADFAQGGDYRLVEVAGEQVIVLRDVPRVEAVSRELLRVVSGARD